MPWPDENVAHSWPPERTLNDRTPMVKGSVCPSYHPRRYTFAEMEELRERLRRHGMD